MKSKNSPWKPIANLFQCLIFTHLENLSQFKTIECYYNNYYNFCNQKSENFSQYKTYKYDIYYCWDCEI